MGWPVRVAQLAHTFRLYGEYVDVTIVAYRRTRSDHISTLRRMVKAVKIMEHQRLVSSSKLSVDHHTPKISEGYRHLILGRRNE